MTTHSAHLSSLCPYRHYTVHIADGSPLFVVEQGTLFSDSFLVSYVSLVLDLTMTVVLFLILILLYSGSSHWSPGWHCPQLL
jgi:hypothetical protein